METLPGKNPLPTKAWLWLIGLVLVTALATLLWDAFTPRSEARFALHMIPHHTQAVKMAQMLQTRTEDATLKAMAVDIIATQESQIQQMKTWLPLWQRPLANLPRLTPQQKAEMGMANETEMTEFAGLSSPQAETRFLQLMIRHHQGALAMIKPALEQVQTPLPKRLLEAMNSSQTLEIEYMERLLKEQGGQPLPALEAILGEHTGH